MGLKKLSAKKKIPTSTVMQSRIPVFLPVKKLSSGNRQGKDITIETHWGSITFKKMKLTQVHRNILDCIMAYNHKWRIYNGQLQFLISLRQLQKHLKITETNHEWLIKKLDEMREQTIVIKTKNWTTHTGLILKHKYSNIEMKHEGHVMQAKEVLQDPEKDHNQNYYYLISFDEDFTELLFGKDIQLHYGKLLPEIINLNNAFLQSIVRFCLSHNSLNMKIEDVFESIGVIKSKQSYKERKILLKKNARLLHEKFNINITDTHIIYNKHHEVFFSNPSASKKNP